MGTEGSGMLDFYPDFLVVSSYWTFPLPTAHVYSGVRRDCTLRNADVLYILLYTFCSSPPALLPPPISLVEIISSWIEALYCKGTETVMSRNVEMLQWEIQSPIFCYVMNTLGISPWESLLSQTITNSSTDWITGDVTQSAKRRLFRSTSVILCFSSSARDVWALYIVPSTDSTSVTFSHVSDRRAFR